MAKESLKYIQKSSYGPANYAGYEGLCYVRVSDKKQETEGHGRESQETRCKQELEKLGVTYSKTFFDTKTGGGDFMQRPALRALLAHIDANPHKKFLVIFDDLKRFARDTEFHLRLRQEFKYRGVVLLCLNFQFQDTPEGEYIEIMFAAQAQLERKQNARQVIQKMKARLDGGYWPFRAKRGYSFKKVAGHGRILVPNKLGVTLIAQTLQYFAIGTLPRPIDVATYLVERKFWSNRKPDKCLSDVHDLLRDPFYAGFIEFSQWEVSRRKGQHKAIISVEMFEAIQSRLVALEGPKTLREDNSDDYPLRGLLVCGECGGHLSGSPTIKRNGKKFDYYFCQTRSCSWYRKSHSATLIHEEFNNALEDNKPSEELEAVVTAVFDAVWGDESKAFEWQRQVMQNKHDELKREIKKMILASASSKSNLVRQEYEQQIEEMVKQQKILEQKLAIKPDTSIPYRTALNKCQQMLKEPVKTWVSLPLQEKHLAFYLVFDGKLSFSRNEGYRTAKTLSKTRLLEQFATCNSANVDPRRLELLTSSMPWMRSTR